MRFLDNMIRIGICDDFREVLQVHKKMTALHHAEDWDQCGNQMFFKW